MNIWCKQNYGFCFLLTFITICYLIIPSISQIEGLETIKCKTCKEQCKAKKGEKTKKGRAAQAHYTACFKDQCANLCKKKVKMAKKGDRIQVILECTEHKNSGLPGTSRYITTKNKKNTTDRIELKKYNPILRKYTIHKEIK